MSTPPDIGPIIENFMNTFMKFFTEAILPMMMLMLFMRMMVAMISGISRAFTGGVAGPPF